MIKHVMGREIGVQADSRGACVRVDMATIRQNAAALRAYIPAKTRLMAVVKANAYGHGLVPTARAALQGGADWLGVATAEEGAALRAAGIQAPCLVLGNVSALGAKIAVQSHLAQTVCDRQGVMLMQEACEKLGKRAWVHLKIDSGMSRIGARTSEEVADVLSALSACKNLSLEGAFTHFAKAADAEAANMQYERFMQLAQALPEGVILHAAASEAALRYPQYHLDMVRMGIALYGCAGEITHPAMQWETQVVYVKNIDPGDAVSYDGTFTADRPMRVATIAAGYGDGYARACSNRASVLIHGFRCPVLGRVCMDQTVVDVSHVPQVCVGDAVVLLGRQKDACITAQELADWADTIPYEALMWHRGRVPVTTENEL